jgi:hypothetical protein
MGAIRLKKISTIEGLQGVHTIHITEDGVQWPAVGNSSTPEIT